MSDSCVHAFTSGAQGSGFGFSVPAGGYDQEDRLTAWNRTDGARNQSWTLSAVGDWTAHSDAGVSQTRTHAAAHELTAVTTGGTTSPLGYDPKGNLLSRPAALASPALGLVWDFDNRLRGADTNGTPATQEVSFEYDALGRRVARSETGSNVVYVHAGQQVIADYARGAAAAAPSFRYVYGSYVDEPLLRHAGTGTTLPTSGTGALYYHRNQQYSIVGLSDAAGTLVERYAYTAYGELTILAPDRTVRTTSSFQNRYTYTGREWDPTLRLYYFRARWLEPKAGRFIGRDPLGYVDGMGLYGAYWGLNDTDPSGQMLPPQSNYPRMPRVLPPVRRNPNRNVFPSDLDNPYTTGIYVGYWQLEHMRFKNAVAYQAYLRELELPRREVFLNIPAGVCSGLPPLPPMHMGTSRDCFEKDKDWEDYWEKYREFEDWQRERSRADWEYEPIAPGHSSKPNACVLAGLIECPSNLMSGSDKDKACRDCFPGYRSLKASHKEGAKIKSYQLYQDRQLHYSCKEPGNSGRGPGSIICGTCCVDINGHPIPIYGCVCSGK